MGYFEGKKQAKKWLVSNQDLEAMYHHFQGKPCIFLWCDWKESDDGSDDKKTSRKKPRRDSMVRASKKKKKRN